MILFFIFLAFHNNFLPFLPGSGLPILKHLNAVGGISYALEYVTYSSARFFASSLSSCRIMLHVRNSLALLIPSF